MFVSLLERHRNPKETGTLGAHEALPELRMSSLPHTLEVPGILAETRSPRLGQLDQLRKAPSLANSAQQSVRVALGPHDHRER